MLSEHGLKIAPVNLLRVQKRPASARHLRDEKVMVEIKRVEAAARGAVYGAEKVWRQLAREDVLVDGAPVARLLHCRTVDARRGDRRGDA